MMWPVCGHCEGSGGEFGGLVRLAGRAGLRQGCTVDGMFVIGGGVGRYCAGVLELLFGDRGSDLGVDLGAGEDHEAGDVEPREKDDDRAE